MAGRPEAPNFTKLKQVGPASFTIQGGLFLVSDHARAHPLNFEYGRQIIERWLRPGETFEGALLKIGEQIKLMFVEQLRIGGKSRAARPLSPYTLAARRKHGSTSSAFLYDTGELADGLEVVLAKPATSGRRGFAGFIIRDKGERFSSHSGGLNSDSGLGDGAGGGNAIGMWRLLNILCSTGLAIYADQLTPQQLRRIMAFRDKFFAGAREASGGRKTDQAWIAEAYPEWTRDDATGGYVDEHGRQVPQNDIDFAASVQPGSPGKGWDTAVETMRQTRRSALGVSSEERERETRKAKPIIFIPPRPLMTDEMRKQLETYAKELSLLYFRKTLAITAAVIGSEPWSPATVSKHAADMSRVEL
jgi:hypothetical protein